MSGLVAIDGHHNLYRILHIPAFQELSIYGRATGGVFGALTVIQSVLMSLSADRCVVVWDSPVPGFRKERAPDYKANRLPKTEEERVKKEALTTLFRSQKAVLDQVLPLLGCRCIEMTGMEGDDLLYAVSQVTREKTTLVSEDMDLAQLVTDRVKLFRPRKEEYVFPGNFVEVTGTRSTRDYVLKKALVGDVSDGIAGIPGVGDVRATALLDEVDGSDLGALRRHCAEHRSAPLRRVAERFDVVERNLELMDLSRAPWSAERLQSVATLVYDKPQTRDMPACRAFLERLRFDSLVSRFATWGHPFEMLR